VVWGNVTGQRAAPTAFSLELDFGADGGVASVGEEPGVGFGGGLGVGGVERRLDVGPIQRRTWKQCRVTGTLVVPVKDAVHLSM
jgi:hypothetical protein